MAEDLTPVRMSDGCTIQAKIIGDDPKKPLMITVHGAPGLSTHVEPQAAYGVFADKFRVLVFDMRGCGDSDKQRPYTHKRWVEDIEELRSVYINTDIKIHKVTDVFLDSGQRQTE